MKLDNAKVKTTLAWQMFGKRYCDLSIYEKKKYMAEMKRTSRAKGVCSIEYNKEYYRKRKGL